MRALYDFLRANPWVAVFLVGSLLLGVYKRIRARARRTAATLQIPDGFEWKSPVMAQTACACGRRASCDSIDRILDAGWTRPNLERIMPDRFRRWRCPDCAATEPETKRSEDSR